MATLVSQPTQIHVTSTNTTVPYTLPTTPGTSRAITHANENFAADVKPNSTISEGTYLYGIFRSYGGGCYNPQYSAHGAWVAAGCGGHSAGPLFGAVAFDFTTGRWISHPVSPAEPQINRDINYAETTSAQGDKTWGEILTSAFPNIPPYFPTPAHVESANFMMPGGNGKGVILRIMAYAGAADSMSGSNGVHMFDLNTNTWARRSTNGSSYTWDIYNRFHDPVSNKWYAPITNLSQSNGMNYLDAADWTIKLQGVQGNSFGSLDCRSGFLMPAAIDGTRLMVLFERGLTRMFGWRLDSSGVQNLAPVELPIASGSARFDNTSVGMKGKWAHNPNDGCWYMMLGAWNDTYLYRVRPPSGSLLTSAWQITRHTITPADGKALPQQSSSVWSSGGSNAQHCSRLFWNSALNCLAWIPGNDDAGSRSDGSRVYLIKPPSA